MFGLLNSIADVLVQPFTQPSRYFVLYTIGMGVAVGSVVHRLHRNGILVFGVFLFEAFGMGWFIAENAHDSDSRIKLYSDNRIFCPVLVYGGMVQMINGLKVLLNRLFQLQHEQPRPTIATGSWDLEGTCSCEKDCEMWDG